MQRAPEPTYHEMIDGMDTKKAKSFPAKISNNRVSANAELNSHDMKVFDDTSMARWVSACRKLDEAGYGVGVISAYKRYSPQIAKLVGMDRAIILTDVISLIAIKSGKRAAENMSLAALTAAIRLDNDEARFRSWMSLMERFSGLAPESIEPVLLKMDALLSRLNLEQLEAWILAGVRAAGTDRKRRVTFFNFEDSEALRWLEHESSPLVFSDIGTELKAYMTALWGIKLPIHEPPFNAPEHARRRPSFSKDIIRIPSSFPGFRGEHVANLYRAALAHIGAHMKFSTDTFSIDGLKPIQVAIISLIEDARVEQLAIREFPGLRSLWLPFHVAQATGVMNAPSLLARLSRGLLDPDFQDADGWIGRGCKMFYDRQGEWDNPLISREIGNLIGNDLGQMRIQFNDKTYVIEPPYRDDNIGLWSFENQKPPDIAETDYLLDLLTEEQNKNTTLNQDYEEPEQGDDDNSSRLNTEFLQQDGIPVARYPEYDYVTGNSRPEWTTIVEYAPMVEPASIINDILEKNAYIVNRIKSLINSAKVSRPERINRQQEGENLDLNACIEAAISSRIGESPDPRIHSRAERRHRDLSVQVLLDISESTKDKVTGSDHTVLELERQATALLAHAMSNLGDPFSIAAFCSNQREDVRYYRIKDFGAPYNDTSKSYLAGLSGGFSTRIGAAMRHASEDLKRQKSHRKLLLVVTDGEPSDIDVPDRSYLVEDARHVIHHLAHCGIDVFCVGLDSGGDSYLERIFGRRNVAKIDRLERLPERLPMLYFRLTA